MKYEKCSECNLKAVGFIETKSYCRKHYKVAKKEMLLRIGKKKLQRCYSWKKSKGGKKTNEK